MVTSDLPVLQVDESATADSTSEGECSLKRALLPEMDGEGLGVLVGVRLHCLPRLVSVELLWNAVAADQSEGEISMREGV